MYTGMRPILLSLLFVAALPGFALAQASNLHSGAISADVERAVNDPARAADKADDDKPAEKAVGDKAEK